MESNTNSYSSPKQSFFRKSLGIIVLILLALGVLWLTLNSTVFGTKTLTEEEVQNEINTFIAENADKPFEFTLVPNALEAVTLPPPPASDAEDAASYQSLKVLAEGKTPEDVADDTIYNFPFQNTTYGEFINDSEYQLTLFQIHDEVRQLITYINQQYQRESLADRIDGVTKIGEVEAAVFEKPETSATYPNVRSAEAFLAANIMARLDSANEQNYLKMAEEFAERGIAYGQYGQSDLEASRSLVSQYLSLYYQNYPDGMDVLSSKEIEN